MSTTPSVVLAYSGGLDTSIIIPWLKENKGLEVHAICGDVGQGAEELVGLEEKALASGAVSCRVVDLREPFLTQCVWPCLRALSLYEGRYLLGTSMARPILAAAQVAYAREVGASAVAHGCTGKGNDQVRFELGFQALAPDLEVIAPWREWDIVSREDAIRYAEERNIPISSTLKKIYSRDRNLWHISHEGGSLEDPACAPPEDVWTWTTDPRRAPETPEILTVGFERGLPVSVNGQDRGAVALLEQLNDIGAVHGIGRIDIVENRLVGMKSRGVYETPGGTILYEAMRSLRALTMERDTSRLCEKLALEHADLVYTGRWFAPLRESLDAFFEEATKHVTGEVTIELYKGRATALSATSPESLYAESLASFSMDDTYDQSDAEGFIRLYGLPNRVAATHHGVNALPNGTPHPTRV